MFIVKIGFFQIISRPFLTIWPSCTVKNLRIHLRYNYHVCLRSLKMAQCLKLRHIFMPKQREGRFKNISQISSDLIVQCLRYAVFKKLCFHIKPFKILYFVIILRFLKSAPLRYMDAVFLRINLEIERSSLPMKFEFLTFSIRY